MKWSWILILVLFATACAGTETSRNMPEYLSLSPASLGRSLSLSQLVTGEYDGQTHKMRFELDITPKRLAIVGLSPLGMTLFTIVREGEKLSVEAPQKDRMPFDPRNILSDIHLTYGPVEILQPALSRLKIRVELSTNGSVRRILGLDGELLVEIKYPANRHDKDEIIIRHYDLPYQLRVETLTTGAAR